MLLKIEEISRVETEGRANREERGRLILLPEIYEIIVTLEEMKVLDTIEGDARIPTEAINSTRDEGTYEKDNNFRGKGSIDTEVKEEIPDSIGLEGDGALVMLPSLFKIIDAGEIVPETPFLSEEDKTIDVGLQ